MESSEILFPRKTTNKFIRLFGSASVKKQEISRDHIKRGLLYQ